MAAAVAVLLLGSSAAPSVLHVRAALLAPTVTSLSSTSGPTATQVSVTVTGTNFVPEQTTVLFGNVPGTNVLVTSPSQLSVTAPLECPGTVPVQVSTLTGSSNATVTYTYVDAGPPIVDSVTPNVFSSTAPTLVDLGGFGLNCVTSISVANQPAQVVNDPDNPTTVSHLRIGVPPEPGNTWAHLVANNAAGSSVMDDGNLVHWAAPVPAITGLSLTAGPAVGGQGITIQGSGLSFATSVSFGGVAASHVTSVSDTQVSATVPPGCGAVPVTVGTQGGVSNSLSFSYQAATPQITGVTPTSGPTAGGNTVTISGSGLLCATQVVFGQSSAPSLTVSSDTQIVVPVPGAPQAGSVDVTVSTPAGASDITGDDAYAYVALPNVASIVPNAGPLAGGNTVTLTGANFLSATQVYFGDQPASQVQVASPTSLTAVAPAGTALGVVPVTVVTSGGRSTSSPATQYTYGPPQVTSLDATQGPQAGGTSVTIHGNNFLAGDTVAFGAQQASGVSVVDAHTITAVSPANSAGVADVTVANAAGSSPTCPADRFTYVPRPVVNGLIPDHGSTAGGNTVVISGEGFLPGTTVSFGGAPAVNVTVSDDGATLTATAPAIANPTAVDVVVTSVGGASALTSQDDYTYYLPPSVTTISPNGGPVAGGTSVSVTGANFQVGTTSVAFGGVAATSVTVSSSTALTAVAPAALGAGVVDVVVSTLGGPSATSQSDEFAYGVPSVTGLSVSAGPTAGGTSVVITGSGFVLGATVAFGPFTAASVSVTSPTSITAMAPQGVAGSVDVTVTTAAGGSQHQAADLFTYDDPPTVSGVYYAAGPTAGGTSVTITGTNFTVGSTVSFGGVAASATTVQSTTSITATSPAHAQGAVDVTVSTPGGTSASSSADRFTYDGVPTVTTVSPAEGPVAGGTLVTVTGTNFAPGLTVSFGGVPGSSVAMQDSADLTVLSPAGTPQGVDVIVTTPGGSSAAVNADRFTYDPVPQLTSVSPAAGPAAGGATISLTGSGFTATSTVSIDGAAASSVTYGSPTALTAVMPAHAVGSATVVVTTPGGTSNGVSFTYDALPAVTSVTPNQGPLAGGTVVRISGSNFTPSSTVTFGGLAASAVSYLDSGTLQATAPAHSAATVDVVVITPGGTSPVSSADGFTYTGLPAVTTVSPDAGPVAGGTTVTISGTNFVSPTTVFFGSQQATTVTVVDAYTITAVSPPNSAGVVDVTVHTAGGTSATVSGDRFAYGAPTVASVTSDWSDTPGGGTVTVKGAGFVPGATVSFGGAAGTGVQVLDATTIQVTVPAHAQGDVDVVVSTPAGSSSTSSGDAFVFGAPVVTAISASAGTASGGDVITITGDGFSRAVTVYFGSTSASVQRESLTTLVVTTPADSAGTVAVLVYDYTIRASNAPNFSFAAPPTLTAISPTAGPTGGGTAVTLTGTNFISGMSVTFGGWPATAVTVTSSTSATATTPAVAAGPVTVVVSSPGGSSSLQSSSANTYTFVAPPTVTSVAPPGGPTDGGTTVTIRGTNFTSAATVRFGSQAATGVTVLSATQITATSPSVSSTQVVDVRVVTPGGTSPTASADRFGYGVPTVLSVSPDAGPVGGANTVTLTGTDFALGPATVSFGSTAAPIATATSTTSITAVVPPGSAGSVDVNVSTSAGTSLTWIGDAYAYGSPSVTAVSPAAGPVAGGTTVTIAGSGFVPGATVSFGATPAQNVVVNSGTSITATAPAESAGLVDVVVGNANGTSTTGAADHYTYHNPPTVTGVSPTAVPQSGGTLTVNGTNFVSGSTSVTVGGVAGDSVTVQSPTLLSVTSPAEPEAGLMDVRVTTPGGTSASTAADTVYAGAPVVVQVSPDAGTPSGGTTVTVSGAGFTADASVWFGTLQATVQSESGGTSLVVHAPSHGTGVVDVTVRTGGGTSATSQADEYAYGPPSVSAVSPDAGQSGSTITVTGTGFVPGAAVSVGGAPATSVQIGSSTSLTATVPAGSGVADVVVSDPAGASPVVQGDEFAFGSPAVTGVSPSAGPLGGGTGVTITGSRFVPGTSVSFGGTAAASVTVASATTIVATAPPHAAGVVDVTVINPAGTSPTGVADLYEYDPVPAVGGVTPSAGPIGGGTSVTISGSGFTSSSTVLFGNTPAASVSYQGASSLIAVSPAEPAGGVHVTVTTPGGTSATSSADEFTFDARPVVSQVSPDAGPAAGGTAVTITGSGFLVGASVSFGSAAATGVSVVNATTITATSPAGAAGSVADVLVTTPGGTSAMSPADSFAYGAPAVTSVTPDAGPVAGGTSVTVRGTGLVPRVSVSFGGVAAGSVTNIGGGQLTAVAPAGSGGVVDVVVSSPAGSSPASPADQYAYGAPTVSSVTPDGGPTSGGTTVAIVGQGFVPGSTVAFGSAQGTVTGITPTRITVQSPSQAVGPVDVTVTTPAGTSATSFADSFAYGVPTVSTVSPNAGAPAGGTTVTITGSNFVAGAMVRFGAFNATAVSVSSRTRITATAPAGSGVVDVSVSTPGGTSATGSAQDEFAYGAPAIAAVNPVAAVTPRGGPTGGGTRVTLTGTGFVPGTMVAFGSAAGTAVTVVSTTSITVTAPAGTSGVVDVTVTTPAGTSAISQQDQYAYGPPAVNSVTTADGTSAGPDAGGTAVTITGTGFVLGATVVIGGNQAGNVTVVSPTSITATTPAGGSSSVAQTVVDTIVSTAAGTSTASAADHFAYDSVPTLSAVTPVAGPVGGGNTVTLTGTNVVPGARVSFGGTPATQVAVTSTTSLTATAPSGAAGAVNVTMTTPGGSTGSATYTYDNPPTLTSLNPTNGPVTNGSLGTSSSATKVTINGSGFTANSTVAFNGTTASMVQVISAWLIYAWPPGNVTSPTTSRVTVTTPGGTSLQHTADIADVFVFGAPSVTSLSPNAGPTGGGNAVTITGAGFTPDVTVWFGGQVAAATVVSTTSITATPPSSPAGSVDVSVANSVGSSSTGTADWYSYDVPTVTSVSPGVCVTSGGCQVTVNGQGFVQRMSVTFGSVAASSWTLSSKSQLTAVAPPEAASSVHLVVSNDQGSSAAGSSSTDTFVFGAPQISALTPNSGGINGADQVTISGSGFVSDGLSVQFGSAAASVLSVSPTQLVVRTPSTTLPGAVTVTVRTSGGSNGAGAFTYNQGYWVFGSTGAVAALGAAQFYGQPGSVTAPIVGSAAAPDGRGYWEVGSDGAVYAFGTAQFRGDERGVALNKPISGMAATPDGNGYWLVGQDGGIFTFGDAPYLHSLPEQHVTPSKPISGIARTPDGQGYWLVGQDGGIFTFGDAGFYNAAAPCNGCSPFLGIVATASGHGYWLVQQGGGIYTFGDAGFYGSGNGNCTCFTSLAAAPSSDGYWELLSAGPVFNFGPHANYYGSGLVSGNAISIAALP